MSDELFRTRFWFDGRRVSTAKGSAKNESARAEFDEMPDIDGLPKNLIEVDFAPQTRTFEVRESGKGRRDMKPPEIEALTLWLTGLSAAVSNYMKPK